jgi:hypothetical protein
MTGEYWLQAFAASTDGNAILNQEELDGRERVRCCRSAVLGWAFPCRCIRAGRRLDRLWTVRGE